MKFHTSVFRSLAAIAAFGWASAAYTCSGDLAGFFEKRSPGSDGDFQVVEEFKIDSTTGELSICGRNDTFNSEFNKESGTMTFGYRRRLRTLKQSGQGAFLSDTWQAEFQGKTSDYRIRVTE